MRTINQPELPLRRPLAINGDQFQQTADDYRKQAAYLNRLAETYEQLAIEAWVRAEINRPVDPYLQTR